MTSLICLGYIWQQCLKTTCLDGFFCVLERCSLTKIFSSSFQIKIKYSQTTRHRTAICILFGLYTGLRVLTTLFQLRISIPYKKHTQKKISLYRKMQLESHTNFVYNFLDNFQESLHTTWTLFKYGETFMEIFQRKIISEIIHNIQTRFGFQC